MRFALVNLAHRKTKPKRLEPMNLSNKDWKMYAILAVVIIVLVIAAFYIKDYIDKQRAKNAAKINSAPPAVLPAAASSTPASSYGGDYGQRGNYPG